MKPYSAPTDKGRTVAGHDVNHRTADQPRKGARAAAKAQRKAARQHGAKQIRNA
jgi:hypothetical protein